MNETPPISENPQRKFIPEINTLTDAEIFEAIEEAVFARAHADHFDYTQLMTDRIEVCGRMKPEEDHIDEMIFFRTPPKDVNEKAGSIIVIPYNLCEKLNEIVSTTDPLSVQLRENLNIMGFNPKKV